MYVLQEAKAVTITCWGPTTTDDHFIFIEPYSLGRVSSSVTKREDTETNERRESCTGMKS